MPPEPEVQPVQTVQLASKGLKDTLIEMAVKQGPAFVLLLIACYFLWNWNKATTEKHTITVEKIVNTHAGTVEKIEQSHTENLKNQAADLKDDFKDQLSRTERMLSGRQDVIEAKATSAETKAAVVEKKVDKIRQAMPSE